MFSEYNIGDTILLKATIVGVEACGKADDPEIFYSVREFGEAVPEGSVAARIAEDWRLEKRMR